MLCSSCRLVNGQAPPGVRTLEELGRWRCSGCGAWNGVESAGAKVVKEIAAASKANNGEAWEKVPRSGDSEGEDFYEPSTEEAPPDDSKQGATGREGDDDSGLTKRLTRSAGKKAPSESSE